jgi:hypothetical protein
MKSLSFYISNLLVNITRIHSIPSCHVAIPTTCKNAASCARTPPSLDAGHGTACTCRPECRDLRPDSLTKVRDFMKRIVL